MPVMSGVEAAFCRSAPWRGFARRVVLPWALADVNLSGAVLEVGGGSGAMAEANLVRHPDLRLTVVDADPAMVAASRGRLSRFGTRVRVALADVTDLPYGSGTFDGVVSFLMLHHVIDWADALAEAKRVLRRGGTFAGYDLTQAPIASIVHRVDRSPHRLYGVDELRAGLLEAGFKDIQVRPSHGGQLVRFAATA